MNKGKSRLVPAVGYLRRSTDKQEASIIQQRAAVEKYAEERGYKIVRWYTDDGISGDSTDKRLDFQRMIADAQTLQDFEIILCWDRARFGRFDSIEAGHYAFLLRNAGVRLATVLDGVVDWNDSSSRIVSNVLQEGKHQQLIDHSANVVRGQKDAAENGSWLGAIPYGYRLEGKRKNKRLVLGPPNEVAVVKRICREYVEEGRSMNQIAIRLNNDGFLSPKGKPGGWRFDSVRVILENPAYTGDFASGRYAGAGKYHTIRHGTIVRVTGGEEACRRPEAEWIVRQDHHEPIIDRAMFEKAQAILALGKTGRSPHTPETNPYILSCLLRCGRCGSVLRGIVSGHNRFYECGNMAYNGKDTCQGTTVREDKVLRAIADHLDAEFLSLDGEALSWKAERKELKPEDLPKGFAKVREILAPPQQPKGERQRAEKRVKELAEQIEKARRNLVLLDAENIPTAQAEIRRLQTEREQLELELRKRPPSDANINAETTAVLRSLYWLAIYFRLTADPMDDPEKMAEQGYEGACLIGDFRPALKPYLRHIAGITIHTRIEGKATGKRHVFEGGEIALSPVGGVTGKLNLSPNDPYSSAIIIPFQTRRA